MRFIRSVRRHKLFKYIDLQRNSSTMRTTQDVSALVKTARMRFEARATEDIMQALKMFPSLSGNYTNHTFPDNIMRWCVSITGTIPIDYKGSTYHIPIALYLMDNHPYSGPFCYVRPTETMRIRVSPVVDDKGRIYLPYLTEWRYPGYSTRGLLQVMKKAFEERSPLYSITSRSSTRPAPQLKNPPYPVGRQDTALPYPSAGSNSIPQPNTGPYPMQNTFPSTGNLYPPSQPPVPQRPSPALSISNGGYQPYQPYLGFSSVPTSLNTIDSDSTQGIGLGSYGTIQPNHIRDSLISAVEDKIRSRLSEKIGKPFAELQSVEVNLQELRLGQQKLKDMLENLERDETQLEIIITTLQDKKLELEKVLDACNGSDSTKDDIDGAIDATTPLHRQIFRCYVQDCAVDDTIYFLGQALKRGIINIHTYLKYVRQLSRKQFVYRATMQKCRLKAKLPV